MGHVGFQIRADVRPDDESYILVAAVDIPSTGDPTAPPLAIAFNGALSTDGELSGALEVAGQNNTTITVTAPGLLTIETKGSTDTTGSLAGIEPAMADGGGSGGNFKLVVPVTVGDHTLSVGGQTDTTSGSYTLDMDFQVAMGLIDGASRTNTTIAAVPTGNAAWGSTAFTDGDDSITALTLQRQGSTSDEDYFVFTMAENASGFLTVQASDGAGGEEGGHDRNPLWRYGGDCDRHGRQRQAFSPALPREGNANVFSKGQRDGWGLRPDGGPSMQSRERREMPSPFPVART